MEISLGPGILSGQPWSKGVPATLSLKSFSDQLLLRLAGTVNSSCYVCLRLRSCLMTSPARKLIIFQLRSTLGVLKRFPNRMLPGGWDCLWLLGALRSPRLYGPAVLQCRSFGGTICLGALRNSSPMESSSLSFVCGREMEWKPLWGIDQATS